MQHGIGREKDVRRMPDASRRMSDASEKDWTQRRCSRRMSDDMRKDATWDPFLVEDKCKKAKCLMVKDEQPEEAIVVAEEAIVVAELIVIAA